MAINITLPTPHPAQWQIIQEAKRFNVLSCGRRFGKTHLTYWLIAEIIKQNQEKRLWRDMAYMSPTYKNLLPTWRRFCKTFEKVITRKDEQNKSVEILGKFWIEFWSLDKPENIRGREYCRVIIDEAALVIALKEIFELIVSPTLNDLIGDLWLFSTPRGFNDFHYYYELGQDVFFDDWQSWIKKTIENPYFPKSEWLVQKRLLTADKFSQEYEGKFVALGNSPFDIGWFDKFPNYKSALKDEPILHKIRYWDIANSDEGDYTASVLVTITEEPSFVVSNAVRMQGKWGRTYPFMKRTMLAEPDVIHVFETEGIGGIAWQVIAQDAELAGIKRLPATKVFTRQSKEERAMLWALELQNGRMRVVQDAMFKLLMDEIAAFPFGSNDDWVDSISGAFLAFIFYLGGYRKLLKSKLVKDKTSRPAPNYEKASIINMLSDEFS